MNANQDLCPFCFRVSRLPTFEFDELAADTTQNLLNLVGLGILLLPMIMKLSRILFKCCTSHELACADGPQRDKFFSALPHLIRLHPLPQSRAAAGRFGFQSGFYGFRLLALSSTSIEEPSEYKIS